MVSLIKNQILKHLSRYTKNLSPDKINLSTLKGEGELTALELDEIVLTDLLELPSWIKLRSATCNKVSFRIQWTKLRSVPIFISLDEVLVDLETCQELNSNSIQKDLSSFGNSTKYGYIHKVIDGITITVNTVCISFYSPAFTATVQIMKILVESKSPEWKKVDLERTRIKDKDRNQVLIFKELEWQDLRFQARSINDKKLPPLLLLTNKSRCRITIKKRISDCFVMGCKLLLILDELLWVLTDTQLKAVLHFIESLSDIVQKSTESTRKRKAARKLESVPAYQTQLTQDARDTSDPNNISAFAFFDVVETSYHFWAQKIDLHLSDDPGDGRSCHRNLQNGGAVHLLFYDLQVDCYPYHLAASDRSHWARYNPSKSRHFQWLSDAHISFKNSLFNLLKSSEYNSNQPANVNSESIDSGNGNETTSQFNNVKDYVKEQMAKVMTSCFVIRIEDLLIHRVATTNKLSQKEFIRVLDRSCFPSEEACFHAEFTYYYYPGDIPFPLPPPKFYVVLSPIIINFDWTTILWFNSFLLKLKESFVKNNQEESSTSNYFDVKIEAVLPKVIFETSSETSYGQRDRPKSLHIQCTRVMLTNVRSPDSSRADLAECIHSLQLGSLFCATSFPYEPGDFDAISKKFINHIQYKDNVRKCAEPLHVSTVDELLTKLSQTMLWIEARDVWCVSLEPLWGDFYGARGIAQNRPVPFLDTFPLKIWFHMNPPSKLHKWSTSAEIHALFHISTLVSVQLNHYQFLFLMKLADEFTELSTIISMDTKRIKSGVNSSLVFAGIVPQVEVTLVMPSQIAGKESSGADAESVIPDTSSMTDEFGTMLGLQCNHNTSNYQDSSSLRFVNINTSPPSILGESEAGASTNLTDNLKSSFNLTSMKKGLTSLIDTALKSTSDDTSKTISIRSDGSSDSGNFGDKFSGNPGDAMFLVNGNETFSGGIEVASEVMEEDDNLSGPTISITTNSENPSNTSFYRRKDMISIVTIKLGQVEFIQQSEGLKSAIKVHISNIALDECPTIPWDEFQSKFVSRTRGWSEVCDRPADRPRIRLRFEHLVTASELECCSGPPNSSWFEDKVTISLANIDLAVNTATISGIAEFIVDEVPSPPFPADITLDQVVLNLLEERLSSMNQSCSSTKVQISSLHLIRSNDGILHIEPIIQTPTTTIQQDTKEYECLKSENDQLRRRLAAMEKLNEEINHLRKCEEEISVLRSYINESQDKVNTLLNEKQSLLDLIKELQCSKGDMKYQNSGKR